MPPSVDFPLEGCPRKAINCPNLQMNFMHHHMEDNIVILNEGTRSHTRYDQCDMLILSEALEEGHLFTERRNRGAEKKSCCLLIAGA